MKNNIPQNKKAKVGPSSSHSTPTMDRLKGQSTPISSKQPTLTRLGYVAASPRYEVGDILQKINLYNQNYFFTLFNTYRRRLHISSLI